MKKIFWCCSRRGKNIIFKGGGEDTIVFGPIYRSLRNNKMKHEKKPPPVLQKGLIEFIVPKTRSNVWWDCYFNQHIRINSYSNSDVAAPSGSKTLLVIKGIGRLTILSVSICLDPYHFSGSGFVVWAQQNSKLTKEKFNKVCLLVGFWRTYW